MITKITFRIQAQNTFYPNDQRIAYGDRHFEQAFNIIKNDADHLASVAQLVSFLNQYPKHNIAQAIGAHTGIIPELKVYTKKRRVYSIPCLWIHEEDE